MKSDSEGSTKFRAGDAVYHPRFGFGRIVSVTVQDMGAGPRQAEASAEVYYEIALLERGTLFVPADRAAGLGLRHLTNGLETIHACLATPPEDLPVNSRQRMAELKASERSGEAQAATRAIRDLLGSSQGRPLSGSEKAWLDQACQRLCTEAALVDQLSQSQALTAIRQAIHLIEAGQRVQPVEM